MTTLVTVTIYANGDCEAYNDWLGENGEQTLDELIEETRDNAIERFEETFDPLPAAHRIIVHVDHFPEPVLRSTRVETTLPDVIEEPIESRVAG